MVAVVLHHGRSRAFESEGRLSSKASHSVRGQHPVYQLSVAEAEGSANGDASRTLTRGGSTAVPAWLGDMLSGFFAGAAGVAAAHPLDTVKVLMQGRPIGDGRGNPIEVAKRLAIAKGPAGFYAGIGGAVSGTAPAVAARMATYEAMRAPLTDLLGPDKSMLVQAISSAAGELAGAAFRNPFELAKQRAQVGGDTVLRGLRSIVATEGVAGLYVGLQGSLLRDLPQTVLNFVAYEEIKRRLREHNASRSLDSVSADDVVLTPIQHLAAGALAGSLSAFLSTPMDNVKTRMMTSGLAGSRPSLAAAAAAVARDGGSAAFFRGALPRTLIMVPDTAVLWMVYELTQAVLRQGRKTT